MNGYQYILAKQTEWAKNSGLDLVGRTQNRGRLAYTTDLDLQPLSGRYFLRSPQCIFERRRRRTWFFWSTWENAGDTLILGIGSKCFSVLENNLGSLRYRSCVRLLS